ncbi:FepA family TonB-dependent siderophore receptor [Ponticoccus sp. (in: a-proteobacteria)]|uniref:FepA family TonB-dependent siderophore receptor n=1 Tax=Ponticoccus sp. (in: a-proteobacteria) TaxID=1925025 RepID=UPI003AB88DB2
MASTRGRLARGSAFFLMSTALATPLVAQSAPDGSSMALGTIVLTAEEQIKQALGVSTITEEDLKEQPVVNDVAEIIRKMPGVNLSGTSPSGQRGNQRQIDIRGMGPENVLILIDGKPVLSRTAVKQGRSGERDTRGDTNWVPVELVESIEVIRGPAAARYGSGAAGGVVNIITKAPEEDLLQLGMKFNVPENDQEGATQRYNLLWAKRLNSDVALRFTASYNKTEGDDPELNAETVEGEVCTDRSGNVVECSYPAGVEGVVNKDATLLFSWTPTDTDKVDLEFGYSRQGNIYAGDVLLGSGLTEGGTSFADSLADEGAETNVMERKTFALTHTGDYAWGGLMSFVQYERTNNRRLSEGLNGGGEGAINSDSDWDEAVLDIVSGKSELYLDRTVFGRPSALTLGMEVRYEKLDLSDYTANGISFDYGNTSADPDQNDPVTEQLNVGLYYEHNIEATDRLTLTPSVRLDWADSFGHNWSGGLNASYALTPEWTINGGIAKAFKSPSLYQMSEQYVYRTRGNGCPYYIDGAGNLDRYSQCVVLGNDNLKPETSINKEIGIAYAGANGINATLTYFHNDYRDKIQSSTTRLGSFTDGGTTYNMFQWDNVPEAVVSGVEGSFAMPLGDRFDLAINGTYMIDSEQKIPLDGGATIKAPLSLVPEYTINGSLSWQATDRLTVIPSFTHFGKIEASPYSATTGGANGDLQDRDPYTLWNLAVTYEFDNGFDLSAGATNIFNTSIKRSGDGANTYNEPERAFYVGLTKTF